MSVRAIRGAIQVDADTREDVLEGSAELVTAVLERNHLSADDIISILFTATPDLTAEFPAYAARLLGLTDVPLMCASEIAVPGAMPRVLRLLYLKDAEVCDYAPDAEELVRFERTVVALWRAIEQATARQDFRPRPSRLCDWCAHRALCPAYGGPRLTRAAGVRGRARATLASISGLSASGTDVGSVLR